MLLGARFDMPTDYMLLNLWGFDAVTGQELWNVTHGQETREKTLLLVLLMVTMADLHFLVLQITTD